MKKLAVLALLGLTLAGPARGQNFVWAAPLPVISGDASGTIAVTNTFQKVFSGANNTVAPVTGTAGARHGCSIQNNGTHTMFITESVGVAGSTLTNSWQVAAGALFNCNFGAVVLTGEIDITGTTADAYVAKQV